MANTRQAIERLTRYVYQAVRRLDSASRTEQMTTTSVVLADGTEHGIVDGIENASDASTGLVVLDENVYDLDDNSDLALEDHVALPERIHPYAGSGDVAFEFGLAVSGRVDEAQTKADQAASDALAAAQEAYDALVKADAAVAGTVVEYAVGSSSSVAPTSGWSTDTPSWSEGTWIWTRTTTIFGSGDTLLSSPVVLTGPPGAPGDPGSPGAPGVGVQSSEVRYQASTSGTVEPTGTWLEDIPTVPEGQYLWTRTVITYSDASVSTAFSVALMGESGAPGADGAPGSDGAPGNDGRGITSTVVTYQGGTSGTVEPTGAWLEDVPSLPAGSFLWTRTVISYTSGTPTTAFSVSRIGEDGTPGTPGTPGSDGADGSDGRGIESTTITYQAGASGTVAPTGTWASTVPTVTAGQYLWTRTVIEYTSGSPSTAFSVGRIGENGAPGTPGSPGSPGEPGSDGRGVTGAVTTYQGSTSGTVIPTGSWAETPPAIAEGQFLWSRTITSYTSGSATTAYAVARQGEKGDKGEEGAQGTSVSTLTRFYFLSTSKPGVPTASPPPAPWMNTEPAYTPGSSADLYEVTRTVMSTGAWSYGPVSKSASFTAAKSAYDMANASKALAEGLYQVIPSVAEPIEGVGGAPLKQGDLWWMVGADDGEHPGEFLGVQVWDGIQWVPRQIIASSFLAPSSVGNILIGDGEIYGPHIATDALDAKVVNSLQLYSSYIEAPTIASSDRLGSGVNKLNDPTFTSTVNTAWVASGHLGDAAATQRDNISWDRTWTLTGYNSTSTIRNWGAVWANLSLIPGQRTTGSVVMANYSWFNKATRTISNPYTFKNQSNYNGQLGGSQDPSFKAVDSRAPITPTARTTTLTNSAVIAVLPGERWNIKLGYTKVSSTQLSLVSSAAVQVVNSSTSAVIWSRAITNTELQAGNLNVWWDSTYSGNIKFRVTMTYTAGGGGDSSQYATTTQPGIVRRMTTDSYARSSVNGVQTSNSYDPWSGNPVRSLAYQSGPWFADSTPQAWVAGGTHGTQYTLRARFSWALTSAVFAQVEPTAGWRLSEQGGLEMYAASGAQTVRLNGDDNFFLGRTATAESGARWEMNGTNLRLYDATNTQRGLLSLSGSTTRLTGNFTFVTRPVMPAPAGDTAWINLSMSGQGLVVQSQPRARVINGIVYFQGTLSSSSLSGGYTTVGNLPSSIPKPSGANAVADATMNSPAKVSFRVTTGGALQLFRSEASGAWINLSTMFYPVG